METPLNDQIMALIVTALALAVAAVVYADMYAHGVTAAAPRDAAALTVFAVLRVFLARGVRRATDPAAPVTEEED